MTKGLQFDGSDLAAFDVVGIERDVAPQIGQVPIEGWRVCDRAERIVVNDQLAVTGV